VRLLGVWPRITNAPTPAPLAWRKLIVSIRGSYERLTFYLMCFELWFVMVSFTIGIKVGFHFYGGCVRTIPLFSIGFLFFSFAKFVFLLLISVCRAQGKGTSAPARTGAGSAGGSPPSGKGPSQCAQASSTHGHGISSSPGVATPLLKALHCGRWAAGHGCVVQAFFKGEASQLAGGSGSRGGELSPRGPDGPGQCR
jgi:hypothetical protein